MVILFSCDGFNDVHVVRGDMTDWLKHGWPVARRTADAIEAETKSLS